MYDEKTYEIALKKIEAGKDVCPFEEPCCNCPLMDSIYCSCFNYAKKYVETYKDRYTYYKINSAPLKTVVMNFHEYNDFVNKTRTKHLEV